MRACRKLVGVLTPGHPLIQNGYVTEDKRQDHYLCVVSWVKSKPFILAWSLQIDTKCCTSNALELDNGSTQLTFQCSLGQH